MIVCPSTDISDKRAEAKLGLAIEHTRRTINASNAATCSVESFLKDGVDYTGSINRMRWEIEVKSFVNSKYLVVQYEFSNYQCGFVDNPDDDAEVQDSRPGNQLT